MKCMSNLTRFSVFFIPSLLANTIQDASDTSDTSEYPFQEVVGFFFLFVFFLKYVSPFKSIDGIF